MFQLNEDMSIYVTRGDVAQFSVKARNKDEEEHTFRAGDVIRFKVVEKKACDSVVLQKDFAVTEDAEAVNIFLAEADTKIGEVISKPTDFWYEVELNPHTEPQTIIGYDEEGAKIFRLYPEGADIPPYEPDEEDIPVVDDELSATSERPVQNQAIARALTLLNELISRLDDKNAAEFTSIRAELENVREDVLSSENTVSHVTAIVDATVAAWLTEHTNSATAHSAYYAPKTHTHVTNYTVAVEAAKWAADNTNGGYKATVPVQGITATDEPFADVELGDNIETNKATLAAWACVTRIKTADGSITLHADTEMPTAAFTVKLKVVK